MPRFDGRWFPGSSISDWSAGKFGTPGWVPNEPSAIEGVVGDQQVALTWTAGRNNGADITGWYIEKNDGSWSVAVADTGSATAAHTVTGLTNGQAYTFRIKGINSVGLSEIPSTVSGSHSPLGAPLAPGTLSLAAGSPATTVINLSWSAGSANGATITGYKIQFSTDGSTWSTATADTSSTATTYSISSGLSQNTLYHVRVAAINSVGVGVYSNVPTLTTDSFTSITATGGTTATYTESGISYKSHKFTSSGNFVVSNVGSGTGSGEIDIMVVGGGGGGGDAARTAGSGGGGAGGMITSAGYSVSATTYAIVIGAGGNRGSDGNVSTGFGLTGGKGGKGAHGTSGGGGTGTASNGSAGGGSGPYYSSGATAYSPGTGGDGGDLVGRPYTGEVASIKWGGGGGGGAGGDGTTGTAGYNHTLNSGNGGAGLNNTYLTGGNTAFAGGGGGGGYNYKWAPQPYWTYGEIAANPGYGGSGGGGKGTYSTGGAYSSGQPGATIVDATAGAANTGGGGGGGASSGTGGSGVVVVRYRTA